MALTTTTVTGIIDLPNGATPVAARVIFELTGWAKEGENIFVSGPVEVAVDPDGSFSVALQTTEDLPVNYQVAVGYRIPSLSKDVTTRLGQIAVPPLGPVVLGDLLTIPAPVPSVPDALAQALAAAAQAIASAESTAPVLEDREAAEAAAEAAAISAGIASGAAATAAADASVAANALIAPNVAAAEAARIAAEAAADASIQAGQWDQEVADAAARLALTGLAVNWQVYQLDTERVWRWNGSAWVDRGKSPLADKLRRSEYYDQYIDRGYLGEFSGIIGGTIDPDGYVAGALLPGGRGVDDILFNAAEFSDLPWGVVDADGYVAIGVGADGSVVGSSGDGDGGSGGGPSYASEFQGVQWQIVDADGVLGVAVSDRGELIFTAPPNRQSMAPGPIVYDVERADIEQMQIHGQSLSIRSGNVAGQPGNAVSFDTGVFVDVAHTPTGFIKTPVQGVADHSIVICASQQADFLRSGYGLIEPDTDTAGGSYLTLATSAGGSGATITALNKGTVPYSRVIKAVTDANALAAAAGKSHMVKSLLWIQGEADRTMAKATYAGHLNTLFNDLQADIGAITGQRDKVMFLLYQPSGQAYDLASGERANTIAEVFYEAWETRDDCLLVTNTYHVTYSDGLHPDNSGSRTLGLKFGEAHHRRMVRGEDWMPVHPTRINFGAAAKSIVVKYHVPQPPLVIDTTAVAAAPALGFDVRDASGIIGITSVDLIAADTVRLTLARAADAGTTKCSYAYWGVPGNGGRLTGIRGNLRDSCATASMSGETLPNWAVAFNKSIPF